MTSALLALCTAAVVQAPAFEPDLDVALGTVGLTSRTARFDDNLLRLFRQGEFTAPIYAATHENPWRTPVFAENLRREMGGLRDRPQEAVTTYARLLGVHVRRSLLGNPNAAAEAASRKEGALAAQLADWKARGWIAGPIPDVRAVPPEVQSAAALVLAVLPGVVEHRRLATMDLGDLKSVFARISGPTPGEADSAEHELRRRLGERIDLGYLCAGAFDLAAAVQEASSRVAGVAPTETYLLKVQTKQGWIVLSGAGDNTHGGEPTLLAIDTGGSETYLNLPSTRSEANSISVVVDSDGNDRYLSDPQLATSEIAKWPQRMNGGQAPGPGAAVLGYAFLSDRKGDDLYRSHRPGLGSGRFGVAGIQDLEGADAYDGFADSIGFATFGLGWVDDAAGNDRYFGFNQVQGCGLPMGVGVVVDRGGDDRYAANDEVLDFPSPQSAQHNVSMAQGAGNGRRADYLDGHSLAGGAGILLDESGNDVYTCGVFGQGVGYWMGLGMLMDAAGTDSYTGQWYVQGASAHYAMGYLEDLSGNDMYIAPMNMAMGAGHDFGAGILIERQGDDRYSGPNLSLGAGNANGIGWFLDSAGTDAYSAAGIVFGSAAEAPKTSLRIRALCLGVFMDLGGDDSYSAGQPWTQNASRTAQIKDRGPTPAESQVGVFWDR